ncbi:MAG: hypothetical protein HY303_10575 [Candidatus Wallbacteria bacterium]|nr:hypothetical protein [Candidatus Wallbacteria bacterium]
MKTTRLTLTLLACALLAPLLAGTGTAPLSDSLLGWSARLLELARDRGAGFLSLSLAVDTSPGAANERAQVEIRTSERLHKFGSFLAMASGPSDSHRAKDRTWTIRFPVAMRAPTLQEESLAAAHEAGQAVRAVDEFLAASRDARATQLQLHRAQSISELPGMKRIPYSLTLIGASETGLVQTVAALTAKQVHVGLRRVELAPAGGERLGTFSGSLLVKAPGEGGALSRPAAESAVSAALVAAGNAPKVMTWSQLPRQLRLELEVEAKGPREAWQTLEALVSIPGLSAFEILEMRKDSRGRDVVSGLLYF